MGGSPSGLCFHSTWGAFIPLGLGSPEGFWGASRKQIPRSSLPRKKLGGQALSAACPCLFLVYSFRKSTARLLIFPVPMWTAWGDERGVLCCHKESRLQDQLPLPHLWGIARGFVHPEPGSSCCPDQSGSRIKHSPPQPLGVLDLPRGAGTWPRGVCGS